MFLLRDGSLTPMYIASLMTLAMLCDSIYNKEVVYPGMLTCDVGMIIDGEKIPEMFLEPLLKVPCRFPYIFHITFQPVTPIPVYYSTLLCDIILVLRGHKEAYDGITCLKADLDPHFDTNVLGTFA